MRLAIAAFLTLVLFTPALAQTQQEIDEATRILHAPQTQTSTLSFWAGYHLGQGNAGKALDYYGKMREIYSAKFGALSPQAIWAASNMALCHQKLGDNTKAMELAKQSLEDLKKSKPEEGEGLYSRQ